ncbi:hypothetical protein MTsPCn3_18300 [Erythrobacter sp. MTPC3]
MGGNASASIYSGWVYGVRYDSRSTIRATERNYETVYNNCDSSTTRLPSIPSRFWKEASKKNISKIIKSVCLCTRDYSRAENDFQNKYADHRTGYDLLSLAWLGLVTGLFNPHPAPASKKRLGCGCYGVVNRHLEMPDSYPINSRTNGISPVWRVRRMRSASSTSRTRSKHSSILSLMTT